MSAAMKILAVGGASPHAQAVLERLARRGWVSFPAETLREARALMESFACDVALCAENLADGKGYDLLQDAKRLKVALFVGLELSGSTLWLPVVDSNGSVTFGERALPADALEARLEEILAASERKRVREALRCAPDVNSGLAGAGESSRSLRNAEAGDAPGALRPALPPAAALSGDESSQAHKPAA